MWLSNLIVSNFFLFLFFMYSNQNFPSFLPVVYCAIGKSNPFNTSRFKARWHYFKIAVLNMIIIANYRRCFLANKNFQQKSHLKSSPWGDFWHRFHSIYHFCFAWWTRKWQLTSIIQTIKIKLNQFIISTNK